MNSYTIIVVGAAGDLAKKKIMPALYELVKHCKDDQFLIVGAGLEGLTTEKWLAACELFIPHPQEDRWRQFGDHAHYVSVDVTNETSMQELAAYVERYEKKYAAPSKRLLYCSIASTLFVKTTVNAVKVGLIAQKDVHDPVWHIVAYEKPFGYNRASAIAINHEITALLNEHQIYRIDHYLAKKWVSDILASRMHNASLESLLNAANTKQVVIVMNETGDLQGRGSFYDFYGALKDVVQNHLLEMLALVAMEIPESNDIAAIVQARADILRNVYFVKGVLGQYEGYQQLSGVAERSKTETYCLLRFGVNTARWADIPFFITTGKCLNKHETYVEITLRNGKKIVFSNNQQRDNAYEVIFESTLHNDHSVSVSMAEIEAAWRIVDEIYAQALPVYPYQKGSRGPEQAVEFAQKQGLEE